jgi:hypothetical protein
MTCARRGVASLAAHFVGPRLMARTRRWGNQRGRQARVGPYTESLGRREMVHIVSSPDRAVTCNVDLRADSHVHFVFALAWSGIEALGGSSLSPSDEQDGADAVSLRNVSLKQRWRPTPTPS